MQYEFSKNEKTTEKTTKETPEKTPEKTTEKTAEEVTEKTTEKTMIKEERIMGQKEKEEMVKSTFDLVIAKAPSISLEDVSKSGISGTAWLAVYGGKTYNRLIAQNIPPLPGTDFYEGWLIKRALTGQFFSTGKMNYNAVTREATLDFIVDGDRSGYRSVVITSEPDDGNPKSDKHVMEGRFSSDVNFQVVLDTVMMEKKAEEVMVDKQKAEEVMVDKQKETTMKYAGEVLAGQSAPLLDFNKADYDRVVKTDKLVVLYFYANWCPICVLEFPVMKKAFNALTTDKVVGFRVNYKDNQTDDDEENLARQFGVPYQHTKVFLKNGQKVLKSPEGWEEERYILEINKFSK